MTHITTAKSTCRILASLLAAHGVTDVVVSPGSRNSPVIVALAREGSLRLHPVIDERSAGFVALGISTVTSAPVAMVCTSGTALLNYAPAVAEAFYRKAPLIVISADRPQEWIDQDDSQTLKQPGALGPWVKTTCDIPATDDSDSAQSIRTAQWLADRLINDALLTATTGRQAPVHINLQLSAPLGTLTEADEHPRVINMLTPRTDLTVAESRRLGSSIASPRKVLIVGGFHSPDQKLNKALLRLADLPNVTIMAESVANLHGPDIIHRIDTTLLALTREEEVSLHPDVIITFGGALISDKCKRFLRKCKDAEHWHVGLSHTTIDCYRRLTLRVEMQPGMFFNQLASAMQPHRTPCDYSARWHEAAARGDRRQHDFVARIPWSDMRAFAYMVPRIPARWNVQLSNGTTVRYFQLFNTGVTHRCDCNRGVSGIDGCTSTAIGASVAYRSDVTLLITGDTCAAYDIGALGSSLITPRLKIVVICNGGGSIFRFVASTAHLEEREQFLCMAPHLPLRQLAEGYGFSYFEAADEQQLAQEWENFLTDNTRPAILAVHTPAETGGDILRNYYERLENH